MTRVDKLKHYMSHTHGVSTYNEDLNKEDIEDRKPTRVFPFYIFVVYRVSI